MVKKIGNSGFISTTYLLMDILPVITELCLVLQKTELDISMVEICVDSCMRDLEKIKSGKSNDEKSIFENDLKLNEDNKLVFKCNHYISKGNRNIETIRRDFIDQIILKLNERFPKEDSNIVYAFGVLGMRPVSMYSGEALENWGKEQIEILLEHFGQEKQHKMMILHNQ